MHWFKYLFGVCSRIFRRGRQLIETARKSNASLRQRERKGRRYFLNFSSIENADTSNRASVSSVETISTPKQIWFTVEVLASQPLAIVQELA